MYSDEDEREAMELDWGDDCDLMRAKMSYLILQRKINKTRGGTYKMVMKTEESKKNETEFEAGDKFIKKIRSNPPKSGSSSGGGAGKDSKMKNSKVKKESLNSHGKQDSGSVEAVDDETLYCLCGEVSYGKMVACDNDLCPTQWFHFPCVSLTTKPKEEWFCPYCRGDEIIVLRN